MKILWLVNVKLPIIYKYEEQENETNVGGWLDIISQKILENKNMELVIVYPSSEKNGEYGKRGNLEYYGIYYDFYQLMSGKVNYKQYITEYTKILNTTQPNVIHIHGTEFQFADIMTISAEKCVMIDRVVISIQGMVKYYSNHYFQGLPWFVIHGRTIKGIIRNESVYEGYKNFVRRGKYEEEAIKRTTYIMGRTNWDKGCTYLINSDAKYFFCNETLREAFYSDCWVYNNCKPFSVFVSQASYPIKGFHIFLNAINMIKNKYPQIEVRVAGANILKDNLIKGSVYGLYIKKLIKRYKLQNNINFLGTQTEIQMKEEMLRANVFVSPSTIENSPNSLGEGMILGVPCISSDVGGVTNLMKHEEEGFIYPMDEAYMLAYYILRVFENSDEATAMGIKAREHAKKTHSLMHNFETMISHYNTVMRNSINNENSILYKKNK